MKKSRLLKFNHLKYSLFVVLISLFVFACSNGARKSGKVADPQVVLELAPSGNNPRNSEGDFVNLKDGRILFVYSRFVGDSSRDHAPAFLAGRYSDDGGNTWTQEDEVIVPNEGGMNVMSVSLLRLQNDDIALFYLRKNSKKDCIPMMRISKDEAKSWSNPVSVITDREGYFVLNNDRVIQLKDGRLLLAVASHNAAGVKGGQRKGLYSYFSDDNGQSWNSSPKVPDTTSLTTQEPGVIELKDGRIMMFIRATGGFQQLSFSSDKGETWSHIETSNIPSPLSPATIEKIPGTDDWLLAWNNNDGSNPDIKGKRTPLTTAISKDEGKTWEYIKNIQSDPNGWYCYIAIHFADDENVLLGYCGGSKPQRHLSVTDITLIDKSWLYK